MLVGFILRVARFSLITFGGSFCLATGANAQDFCANDISAQTFKVSNIKRNAGSDALILQLENGRKVRLPFVRLLKEAGDVSKMSAVHLQNQVRLNEQQEILSDVFFTRDTNGGMQADLVTAGKAVVTIPVLSKYSDCEDHTIRKLAKLEREARAASIGVWSDQKSIILKARDQELWSMSGQFVLVEGLIKSVSKQYRKTFINFDDDWRKDFTLSIDNAVTKSLEKDHGTLTKLALKEIRVRGWLNLKNGPNIDVHHRLQIEVLGEK